MAERLVRLEEHAGFAEHTVDTLSAEIAELNRKIHRLAARIDAVEHRLFRLADAAASNPAVPSQEPSTQEGPLE